MQLRNLLVATFTIALILISLFQLSFNWKVNSFEKDMLAKAEKIVKSSKPDLKAGSDAFKTAVEDVQTSILDTSGSKKIYGSYTYQEAKEQEMNLGLDLQGGMNVVLEVGVDQLVNNLSTRKEDPAFRKAMETANANKATSDKDFITLFYDAFTSQNQGAKLAAYFAKPGQTEISTNSTNDEVLKYIRGEAKVAVTNTYNVLQKRIDKFGVAQPTINIDESKDIITVELAGAKNPEKIRTYLQSSAKLEFWETYSNYELTEALVAADKNLRKYLDGEKVDLGNDSTKTSNTDKKDTAKTLESLLNNNKGTANAKDTSKLSDDEKLAKDRREKPLLYAIGFIPPQQNKETGKYYENAIVGMIEAKDTTTFNKYIKMDIVKNSLPAKVRNNIKFLLGKTITTDKGVNVVEIYAIKKRPGTDAPWLDGSSIEQARHDYSSSNRSTPVVNMRMTPDGAEIWKNLTGRNIGKPIAVVLDDVVYSAPAPRQEIAGGNSEIEGGFKDIGEAEDLGNILKSGKLDAPAKIVQEQVVGATLGSENIKAGFNSFIIAFIVIFALMLLYFNTGGWVANIALILNLLFTVGVLSALHATLTVAGIAGLILTIGMAVDTNVIIFERIKEELANGKNYKDAINEGYKRSLNPVLDGHVTMLLTAIILFIFGLGPVLGFATTQILGILLSLFCGILLSRLVTDIFMRRGKHLEYFTTLSRKIFRKSHFKFIEARKIAYGISLVVLILGIAAIFNGFHYGVEFSGGRSYTVKLDKNFTTNQIRDGLKGTFSEAPIVKTIGNKNQVNITTAYKVKENSPTIDNEVANKLYQGLKSLGLNSKADFSSFARESLVSQQKVSPTISDDLKKGAKWATIISIIIISIYIILRFRKWQYSLGTVVALLHDVFVTLAVFSFFKNIVPFSLEIDQHFIAAVLTVIGFSMNDTVIVFDRIREYFTKRPGADKKEVINSAINDTLSRTIMTSLTVFLTLLILFIFGGEPTKGFAFAMMIGVITGTYSSIFVAAPILVDMDKGNTLGNEIDKEKKIAELKAQS